MVYLLTHLDNRISKVACQLSEKNGISVRHSLGRTHCRCFVIIPKGIWTLVSWMMFNDYITFIYGQQRKSKTTNLVMKV